MPYEKLSRWRRVPPLARGSKFLPIVMALEWLSTDGGRTCRATNRRIAEVAGAKLLRTVSDNLRVAEHRGLLSFGFEQGRRVLFLHDPRSEDGQVPMDLFADLGVAPAEAEGEEKLDAARVR